MKLSEDLAYRGLINQTTFTELGAIDQSSIKFYLGVDPSSDSMTIGNLAAILLARRLAEAGHKAYLMVGGATGQIGDPDGKKDERVLKDLDTVNTNKVGIVKQFRRLFDKTPVMVVDNWEWFKDINYITFLREVGKHVPMSQLLGREFIKSRLGEEGTGISYAEFSYNLIQAFDFVHLNRTYGISLQICGADQWGNSVSGVDLLRRIDSQEAHVLSLPLVINKSTGRKFGKSEDGAIWLDENKTSVYQFFQFWLNLDDAGVIDYLKIYTFLPKEEIDTIEELHQTNPGGRVAQRALAKAVTGIVHGEARARSVERVSRVLFGELEYDQLEEEDLAILAKEIPTCKPGKTLVEILTEFDLADSNSQARRLIEGGAISLNGEKLTADQTIEQAGLIKKGKNSFVLVKE